MSSVAFELIFLSPRILRHKPRQLPHLELLVEITTSAKTIFIFLTRRRWISAILWRRCCDHFRILPVVVSVPRESIVLSAVGGDAKERVLSQNSRLSWNKTYLYNNFFLTLFLYSTLFLFMQNQHSTVTGNLGRKSLLYKTKTTGIPTATINEETKKKGENGKYDVVAILSL